MLLLNGSDLLILSELQRVCFLLSTTMMGDMLPEDQNRCPLPSSSTRKHMTDSSSIPLPAGFRAGGCHAGIKTASDQFDLALFVSDVPASAAGTFTTNRVVGAPVRISRARVPSDAIRAVVINSGNANACTGERGLRDAERMTASVAQSLKCDPQAILVCSTGVIGHFLPIEQIEEGIQKLSPQISPTEEAFHAAACGMMTTDTFPKQAFRQCEIEGRRVLISGAAKGAAMIAPNMATMLAVIMTDASIEPALLTAELQKAVDLSFNAISVDGHTSTSDTVLALANGRSGVVIESEQSRDQFASALQELCTDLAKMIVQDAEGAEHFVTVDVSGLRTINEARQIAKAICEGALVKTAITGNDPNWGRIVSAAGYAGVEFAENDVSLWINGTCLYQAGSPVPYDAERVSTDMSTGEVHIDLRFTLGEASARMWTSDLTQEYVQLNSEYTT